MASFSSTFEERLQHMEETRNQRLFLLQVKPDYQVFDSDDHQAENDLQNKKRQILSTKLSSLRCAEQRCLLFERRIAEISAMILAEKYEIEVLDARYKQALEEHRALKKEILELEEARKDKDSFYESMISEMESFKESTRKCLFDSRSQVQTIQDHKFQLQSTLEELQGRDGYLTSSEIIETEKQKSDLLTIKHNLDINLASNYQMRSILQKRLMDVLVTQNKQIS